MSESKIEEIKEQIIYECPICKEETVTYEPYEEYNDNGDETGYLIEYWKCYNCCFENWEEPKRARIK